MKPQIGQWTTFCCHRELEQILTDERIAEIVEDMEDGIPWRFWESRDAAVAEIASCFPEDSEGRNECLQLLNKTT